MFCQCLGSHDSTLLYEKVQSMASIYNWTVKNILTKRITWNYYIEIFSDLICNMHKELSKDSVKEKFYDLNYELNSTYIYTNIIKIVNNGILNLKQVNLFNPWNLNSKASLTKDCKLNNNKNNIYIITLNNSNIKINKELYDILNKLTSENYKLNDIITYMHSKSEILNKSKFEYQILEICQKFEQLGVITRFNDI